MNDVPLAGLAFAVKGLQGRLAVHIVQTPIHTPDKPVKGMALRFAATAAEIRHGALLHRGGMAPPLFCRMIFFIDLLHY
jgi:hypothetical protein